MRLLESTLSRDFYKPNKRFIRHRHFFLLQLFFPCHPCYPCHHHVVIMSSNWRPSLYIFSSSSNDIERHCLECQFQDFVLVLNRRQFLR